MHFATSLFEAKTSVMASSLCPEECTPSPDSAPCGAGRRTGWPIVRRGPPRLHLGPAKVHSHFGTSTPIHGCDTMPCNIQRQNKQMGREQQRRHNARYAEPQTPILSHFSSATTTDAARQCSWLKRATRSVYWMTVHGVTVILA